MNLTDYDAQEGFDVLAPGWYEAEVIDSEIKSSKAGNTYINWTFQVLGKPNRVWETTVIGKDVAMKILKTMATCCGHRNPNYIADTEELHGKRCQIKLKIKTDPTGEYEPKNEITAFKPSETAGKKPATYQPPQQAFTPPPVQQQPVIPADVPPAHVIAGAQAQPTNTSTKPKMPWE